VLQASFFGELDKQRDARRKARAAEKKAQQQEWDTVKQDVRLFEKEQRDIAKRKHQQMMARRADQEAMRKEAQRRHELALQRQAAEDAAILRAVQAGFERDRARERQHRLDTIALMNQTAAENEELRRLKFQQQKQERDEDVRLLKQACDIADATERAKQEALAHLERRQIALGNSFANVQQARRQREREQDLEMRRVVAQQAKEAEARRQQEIRLKNERRREYCAELARQIQRKQDKAAEERRQARRDAAALDALVEEERHLTHVAKVKKHEAQNGYLEALREQSRFVGLVAAFACWETHSRGAVPQVEPKGSPQEQHGRVGETKGVTIGTG